MSNAHYYYNGLCDGCQVAIKQEDVDADKLYLKWLCSRCRLELEKLPLRYQRVFDRLSKKMRVVADERETFERQVKLFKNYMVAHGLNPDEAHDGYMNSPQLTTESEK